MKETYSILETDKIAKKLLEGMEVSDSGATVLALVGDLGAGKTTLVKSIATLLGIQDTIVSPTFVIAKFYEPQNHNFKKMIHIDAYRIDDVAELDKIGWGEIMNDKGNLVVIEWPMKIESYLPKDINIFSIEHGDDTRTINKIK